MIDWLVLWGVTQAAGIVVYPILESLAQEASKDFVKDFFKGCLKKVIHLPEKDVQKEAYGKALKVFLELIQDELLEADYQEAIIKQYIPFLKKFIDREDVAEALGMAFDVECKAIDTALLVRAWAELNSPLLPESLNWDFLSKAYIRAVKKLVQNSDKLRPIFEVQIQAATADAVQELAGIVPAFDLAKYAEGLREQYGNLKLESLDTTGVYYNELKLWKIFIAQNVRGCQEFIPQVYELPKDKARELQERDQLDALELLEMDLERHRQRYVEQPIRGVFEVVGDPNVAAKDGVAKYAVILGDPGSGKSTLLQYLALIWAERSVRDLPLHPLPLLLELRTYARDKQTGKCQDIVSFIHGGNITCRLNQQELHEKLNRGDVIALFDGIDEVFDPALRDEVVTDIHRFTNEYPKVRAVATSRWLGYKAQRLRDAGFQHFMLQELNDQQMQEFVLRWHDLNFAEGADKERKRERLQKAIRESRSIKELAGNPLLLTMMAILNRNQELPRDRPELYNQASRVLLHQWDVERALVEDSRIDPKTIDYRDKQAMLRKVAYHMQSSAKGLAGNLISAAQLESILMDYLKTIEVEKPREIARIMIKQLRTRNFILCDLGGDSYGFVHRTFLEYFCAWEFVWQFKETQTLTIEQLIYDVFGNHWQDESWHEVLRLISGMIEPRFVEEIIDFLLEQKVDKSAFLDEGDMLKKEGLSNLLLAADCFVEVRNRNLIAPTSSKLLKTLQREAEQEIPYKFNSELALRLINNIASIWQDSSGILDWLKKCLEFGLQSFIPASAVLAIAQGWKEDTDTLPWLKDRALTDQNEYVRMVAVQAISQGWKDDTDTLPLLKDRVLNDEDNDVRMAAVREIAKGWKDDPDTLPWLKDRALTDQNWVVRMAAVREIAKGWKDDPDTLPWLKDRALTNQNEYVRMAAVLEIAQGWKDDTDTLTWLKDRALNDQHQHVRSTAVREIAQGWKEDTDTLPLLKDRALNDQNWEVRWAAVQAIANGWKEDTDTLPLLKDRALNDQNWEVRWAAVQAIANGWKDDPQTFDLLYDHSIHNPFERKYDWQNNPRQTALQAILKHYRDKPQTLELLKAISDSDLDEKLKEFAKEELAKLSKNPEGT
jgi:predicted NACHT family NTPase